MSEEELRNKIAKYTRITEELTNQMNILAEGGLNITEELRNIQDYSPSGINEPEMMENRTNDLEQEFEKLQRVFNEMNKAHQAVDAALQLALEELDTVISKNSLSAPSMRSARRSSSRRSSGRGIQKKHKNKKTKRKI